MSNTTQVGQFRKDQLENYTGDTITLTRQTGKFINNNSFKVNQIYYVPSLHIQNNGGKEKYIDLILVNGPIEQVIKTVPFLGEENKYIDFAFVPKKEFKEIHLRKRSNNASATSGQSQLEVIEKKNILDSITDIGSIKKLGFQATPGFTFILNGEIIRVGKSGTYSISDIDINSIGIINDEDAENMNPDNPIPFNEDSNYFLMDYQYIKEV